MDRGVEPETENSQVVSLVVNGSREDLVVDSRVTLADLLRDRLGLTGTHLGCEHGVCGACTVLLDGAAVRSCLIFAVQADECEIVTVEALGTDDGLSDLQRAFDEHNALQCGYCTPGFLMLGPGLLLRDPEPSDDSLRETLASNLCRCTGYHSIADAVRSVVVSRAAAASGGGDGAS